MLWTLSKYINVLNTRQHAATLNVHSSVQLFEANLANVYILLIKHSVKTKTKYLGNDQHGLHIHKPRPTACRPIGTLSCIHIEAPLFNTERAFTYTTR